MSVDSVLYRHWQARAEEAEAEVERLRAALKLAVEFVDRVQQFGRLTRADAVAPGPMEMSAAVLATTLRAALAATPVAPAPNSAPNMPEAGERCAWRGVGTGTCGSVKEHPRHSHRGGDACEDESGECSRDFAYCHPFQPEPAPGELTNLIRQQQASGGGPVTAVMVSRSGDEPDPTTLLEPAS